MNFDYDIAVIGAGPAGSTAAALLADKGYRVLVLERDRHPRFHIGESLLPLNLPLFDKLGVADRIAALGLVKRGAEFHSQEHGRSLTFPFAEGWPGAPAYAYQVRRSEFDLALLGNARDKGAQVIEGCRVDEVHFDPERVLVVARADDDAPRSYSVRYLVDASGRETFMAGKLKIKHRNSRHASAALYGHFRGARRNSGVDEGNIGIYWFAHGWMWFIPLADGTTSVGAVCWPYYLKTRADDPTTFFQQTLQLCPALWDRVRE